MHNKILGKKLEKHIFTHFLTCCVKFHQCSGQIKIGVDVKFVIVGLKAYIKKMVIKQPI